MKTKYIVLGAVATLIIGVAALVVRAHAARFEEGFGPGDMFHGRMGWIARQLDLTDAQKTEIKSMIQAERPTINPLVRQLASGRQQMLAATVNGAFDQAKVQTIANQQAQVMAQLMVEREKLISAVYQKVLTPEQRTKADALRQRMTERINQHLQKLEGEENTTQQ